MIQVKEHPDNADWEQVAVRITQDKRRADEYKSEANTKIIPEWPMLPGL